MRAVALVCVVVLAVGAFPHTAEASLWPLKRYKPCKYSTIQGGGGNWKEPDVSLDADSNVYWLTAGPQVFRLGFADNAVLGRFTAGEAL